MAFKFKNKFYKQSYIEFRLTTISRENEKKLPQCVVCFKVLSSKSMKPSLLKCLLTNHSKHPV